MFRFKSLEMPSEEDCLPGRRQPIYSPENLASLLEDKVEMTREEKIAMFKAQQKEQLVTH